jgi:hypothetical protein
MRLYMRVRSSECDEVYIWTEIYRQEYSAAYEVRIYEYAGTYLKMCMHGREYTAAYKVAFF